MLLVNLEDLEIDPWPGYVYALLISPVVEQNRYKVICVFFDDT